MKRYRVWQANREVFLWPENWLYPELRDNQSPFFQQMMSSLLQGDITDDAAASAYLDYLTGLEEVAKLEPCGLYYQPGTADTDETSYVVARTAGAHRKYYFRQLDGGLLDAVEPGDDRLRGHAGHADRLERPAVPVLAQGGQAGQPSQTQLTATTTGTSTTLADLTVSDLNSFTGAAASNAQANRSSLSGGAVLDRVLQRQMAADQDLRRQPADDHRAASTRPGPARSRATGTDPDRSRRVHRAPPLIEALYNTEFTLPPDALILAISVARAVAGRRVRPAQHAQPAGALRGRRVLRPSTVNG